MYGFPKGDAPQVIHYIKDGHNGGLAINAPTTSVQDIVGKSVDKFETITWRYLKDNPMVKQSIYNKLKIMGIMIKAMVPPKWDMDKYEIEQGFPIFEMMVSSNVLKEWKSKYLKQIK